MQLPHIKEQVILHSSDNIYLLVQQLPPALDPLTSSASPSISKSPRKPSTFRPPIHERATLLLSSSIYPLSVQQIIGPSQVSSQRAPLLAHPRHLTQPALPVLHKDLHSGLQHALHERKIIYRPEPQYTLAREHLADTIHQRAARLAEIIRHGCAGHRCLGVCEGAEVSSPARVLEVRVQYDEVGREHGRGDLVTVGAMADEGCDEAGGGEGKDKLDGTAEACRCRFSVRGPAIVGEAGQLEVGFFIVFEFARHCFKEAVRSEDVCK